MEPPTVSLTPIDVLFRLETTLGMLRNHPNPATANGYARCVIKFLIEDLQDMLADTWPGWPDEPVVYDGNYQVVKIPRNPGEKAARSE